MMYGGVNLASEIRKAIDKVVREHLEGLPKTLPCVVIGREKNKVQVQLLVNVGYLQSVADVPIAQSPYCQTPIKAGDVGVLVPMSYYSAPIYNNNLTAPQEAKENTALGDWVFLPVLTGATVDNISDLVFSSQDGQVKIVVNAQGVEITTPGTGKIEVTAGGVKINGGALEVQ